MHIRPRTLVLPGASLCALACAFLCGAVPVRADTMVTLGIGSDTTWGPDAGPYVVSGQVEIAPGATLTILPGTVVKFQSDPGAYSGLNVRGSLVADGTPSDKIYFTSDRDLSVGAPPVPAPVALPADVVASPLDTVSSDPDADADFVAPDDVASGPDTDAAAAPVAPAVSVPADQPSPAGSDYRGLSFEQGSSGDLQNVEIRYAQQGISAVGTTLQVRDSAISHAADGLILQRSIATLDRTAFSDNVHSITTDLLSNFSHEGTTVTGDEWHDAIRISGQSSENPVLDNTDGLPYIFTDRGYEAELKTLTIEHGVTIYILDNQGATNLEFLSGQQLSVDGTASDPVHFDAVGLDIGNGSSATVGYADFLPGVGQMAMTGHDGGRISADHVTVTGGAGGCNITNDANLVLSDSEIDSSESAVVANMSGQISIVDTSMKGNQQGVVLEGTSSADIRRTVVADSSQYAVWLYPLSSPTGPSLTMEHSHISGQSLAFKLGGGTATVTESDIHGPQTGATAESPGSYDLRNNWWGDPSGPYEAETNPKGLGAPVSSGVLFDPWLGVVPADDDPASDPQVALAPQTHLPVILVPGIMGTQLSRAYGDHAELWPAVDQLILSPFDTYLDDLAMPQSGIEDPDRPMAVGDIVRSIDPPVGGSVDTWNGLIAAFESAGYVEGSDLFVFPYDWRQNLDIDAGLLSDKIETVLAATGKPQVDIVAHSLGGLVVKDYIASQGSGKIAQLAYIGTPHVGAPKAAKAVLYGDDMGVHFGPIHILDPDEIKAISQNMPSVYDLMPSRVYAAATNTSMLSQYAQTGNNALVLGKDYDESKLAMFQMGANLSLLDDAEALHDGTDSLNVSPGTTVENFVGCGDGTTTGKTLGAIVVKNRLSHGIFGGLFHKDYQLLYTNGDGTVPLFSAEKSVGTRYYIHNTDHDELPSAPGVPEALLALFSGQSPVGGGVFSPSEPVCDLAGTVVSVHGPVALDVYDGNGNHAGLAADGHVETQIPGVSFDTIGDASFAVIPAGQIYTVQVTPRDGASGQTYDAYVQATDASDAVTSQEYFNAVPVPSAGATTRIAYAPDDGSSPTISYSGNDRTNGQESSGVVVPSATLTGAQASDTEPPTTTAALTDSGAVVLTANDDYQPDASGVLRTDYSVDGVTWQPYTAPIQLDGSETAIAFASTDNAGNTEAPKSFTVPASPAPVDPSISTNDGAQDTPPADGTASGAQADPAALSSDDAVATESAFAASVDQAPDNGLPPDSSPVSAPSDVRPDDFPPQAPRRSASFAAGVQSEGAHDESVVFSAVSVLPETIDREAGVARLAVRAVSPGLAQAVAGTVVPLLQTALAPGLDAAAIDSIAVKGDRIYWPAIVLLLLLSIAVRRYGCKKGILDE